MESESTMRHILVILGQPFLATSNAIIHCRNELLKPFGGNITLETNISTVGNQSLKVDQIKEVNFIETIMHVVIGFLLLRNYQKRKP